MTELHIPNFPPRKFKLYFATMYRPFIKLYATPENWNVASEFMNMLDCYPMNCKEKRITYHKRESFPCTCNEDIYKEWRYNPTN